LPADSGLLRGVDRAAFAVAVAGRVRAAGVPVGLTAVTDFVHALAARLPATADELYWTARITLVKRPEDIGVLDLVFAESPARRTPAPARTRGDRHAPADAGADGHTDGGGLPWATLPPAVDLAEDGGGDLTTPQRLASAAEALADRPFEELNAEQLRLLGQWLRAAIRRWPARRSRRLAGDPAGHRIAVRPTIARARRTGWEPIRLVRVKPVHRPRRVVLLCDVSQSMQAQVPAYRVLMTALAEVADAATFAFATRLTRGLGEVPDRFGGTRIATSVEALLRRHGDLVRGAVVLIASDGWDSDPPERLAAAMRRLRLRAYRVVWLNPRAGAAGFAPEVAAMAAALPHCDALLPADTFGSLRYALDRLGAVTSWRDPAGAATPWRDPPAVPSAATPWRDPPAVPSAATA
jgi:uncharacterized protein with von Willebrand factor type A (vWA) domain